MDVKSTALELCKWSASLPGVAMTMWGFFSNSLPCSIMSEEQKWNNETKSVRSAEETWKNSSLFNAGLFSLRYVQKNNERFFASCLFSTVTGWYLLHCTHKRGISWNCMRPVSDGILSLLLISWDGWKCSHLALIMASQSKTFWFILYSAFISACENWPTTRSPLRHIWSKVESWNELHEVPLTQCFYKSINDFQKESQKNFPESLFHFGK